MVLITSCLSCLKLMLLPLKLRSIQSTQGRAPDLELGGKYKLSKTKMKFAWDMDETLFSAISSEAPSKNTTHRTQIYFTGSRLQENRKKKFPSKKPWPLLQMRGCEECSSDYKHLIRSPTPGSHPAISVTDVFVFSSVLV